VTSLATRLVSGRAFYEDRDLKTILRYALELKGIAMRPTLEAVQRWSVSLDAPIAAKNWQCENVSICNPERSNREKQDQNRQESIAHDALASIRSDNNTPHSQSPDTDIPARKAAPKHSRKQLRPPDIAIQRCFRFTMATAIAETKQANSV
jgi:hypothetical protein